jgi:hypothetical protein
LYRPLFMRARGIKKVRCSTLSPSCRVLPGPAPGGRDPNEVLVGRGQLASRRRRFVSMTLASINSLNSRSTSSATFASISSSVRGKLTTIVSPLSGLMGSLVAPLRWLVGEHVRQNSLCKTLRLTHAFSCMSRPAMPTRKICNSRVLISASMRCRVWDTPL